MIAVPYRQGAKPKTYYGLPHQQLDQNPPSDIYSRLKDRAYDFPFVERRPSIISVPGAEALWLLDEGGQAATLRSSAATSSRMFTRPMTAACT